MKAKVVEDTDVVTYVVVCDPGDEAVSALTQFARSERLEAAQITAAGQKIECPVLVLWGTQCAAGPGYDPPAIWQQYARPTSAAWHCLPATSSPRRRLAWSLTRCAISSTSACNSKY
jgi:hypothetical protein